MQVILLSNHPGGKTRPILLLGCVSLHPTIGYWGEVALVSFPFLDVADAAVPGDQRLSLVPL